MLTRCRVAVLLALCCAFAHAAPAPLPKPSQKLPAEVQKWLKKYAETYDGAISQTVNIVLKEKDEGRRQGQLRALAKMVRLSLQEPVVYLKNVLAYPDRTLNRRKLTQQEVRAIERTIEEYRKRLAQAVKRGEASPEEKPAPGPKSASRQKPRTK